MGPGIGDKEAREARLLDWGHDGTEGFRGAEESRWEEGGYAGDRWGREGGVGFRVWGGDGGGGLVSCGGGAVFVGACA